MKLAPLLHRLRYFTTDAWDEWRHSPGVNLLAVATLTSVLFLAGLVLLVLSNVERRVEQLRAEIRVEIYFREEMPHTDRAVLHRELEAAPGVARVEYINKREALRRYRQWAGEQAELIDELETNPLPASLEVFLTPGPGAEAIAERMADDLRAREGLEAVRFDREWARRLESVLNLARVGGSGLGILVLAAVVFIMASVLRLAVYARRDEIEIMLLVGATPAFVRGPFLMAGLGQGLIASGLSLVIVEVVRRMALSHAGSPVLGDLIARPLPINLSIFVIGVGLVVSFTGALFAVRRSV